MEVGGKMTDQFDIVVAGAGHNSLVAAAYLARAGLSCLILEARPVIGGNTMTEELTLPGFLHDTCSTTHSIFMESPIWRNQELPLADYGLEYISADPASHIVFSDGSYITQWMDIDSRATGFIQSGVCLVASTGALCLGHYRLLF